MQATGNGNKRRLSLRLATGLPGSPHPRMSDPTSSLVEVVEFEMHLASHSDDQPERIGKNQKCDALNVEWNILTDTLNAGASM